LVTACDTKSNEARPSANPEPTATVRAKEGGPVNAPTTIEARVVARGFLLPAPVEPAPPAGDPLVIVVPELRAGLAYMRVTVTGARDVVVVVAFDDAEEKAAAAASAALVSAFADAEVVRVRHELIVGRAVETRAVASGEPRPIVAAVTCAFAANTYEPLSHVLVELNGHTFAGRPERGAPHLIEVVDAKAAGISPRLEPRPAPVGERRLAILERATETLSKRIADPEGAFLYRSALRDLATVYRRAGMEDAAMAALRLCQSMGTLVLAPLPRDIALDRQVDLELRGLPGPEVDMSRWLPYAE
jgi:hypothetical protein